MTRKTFINMYIDFIQCAIKLNEKAKKYEIASLENEIYDLDDNDLRMGLRFVIDGTEPAVIEEIFSNMITFEKDKYMRQLKIIKKRAILGIQKQESFRTFYYVLNSYANLTKKETNKIDYIILKDENNEDASESSGNSSAHESFYARYTFKNSRHWTIAIENIENELGKDPTGVNFGDAANPVITSMMNCPDPHKLDKIIEECEGVAHSHYRELDTLGLDG